jgi:hypothetical protein
MMCGLQELRVGNIYKADPKYITSTILFRPFLLLSSTVHTEHEQQSKPSFAPLKIQEFQKIKILTKDKIMTLYLLLNNQVLFEKLNDNE